MADRVLIFGGTFDPPHRAHATLPPLAAAALGCGRIIYVPATINPLKADLPPAPSAHRLAMLRLALRGVENAEVSTIELDRPGPSYTIDSLRELARRYPGAEFRLLIGSDQALEFGRWKDWAEILRMAPPAVMLRPPLDREAFRRRLLQQASQTDSQAEAWLSRVVDVPSMDINATDLRRRLATGQDASDLLDPAVLAYIRANHLYGR